MRHASLVAALTTTAIAASFATASVALASAAAPVLRVDKTFGKVAGWSIGYSKTTGGCLAAAAYGDGTTVWFGFGGTTNSAFLAFTNPKWRGIEVGQSYIIRLVARGNGNWYGTFAGFEREGVPGIFASSLKDKFVADLADAGGLDISLNGRPVASLSLVGSLDALAAVMACQKGNDGNHDQGPTVADKGTDDAPASSPGDKGGNNEKSVQGTGFYVSDKGHVLTNNHVIDGCSDITVTHVGSPSIKARLVARDATNDLAVLSTDVAQLIVPPLSMRARIGESVYAYGYPLNGILATNGNFTIGNVTASEGLGDDSRELQISAPVQPGNSGGPLVDQYGNVVGVIVSKLNALKMASVTQDVPQNVNFAIKSTIALNFLEANGIEPPINPRSMDPMTAEAIADKARSFTVRVNCH